MALPLPLTSRIAAPKSLAWLSIAQGAYYVLTAIWPLLSDATFQAITGPQVDLWRVKTVGVLVAVIGGVLIMAGARAAVSREIFTLAVGSAFGLAAVDIVYVTIGRIPPIYLLDAAAEAVIIAVWVLLWLRSR
jgi:hypothetical protein